MLLRPLLRKRGELKSNGRRDISMDKEVNYIGCFLLCKGAVRSVPSWGYSTYQSEDQKLKSRKGSLHRKKSVCDNLGPFKVHICIVSMRQVEMEMKEENSLQCAFFTLGSFHVQRSAFVLPTEMSTTGRIEISTDLFGVR